MKKLNVSTKNLPVRKKSEEGGIIIGDRSYQVGERVYYSFYENSVVEKIVTIKFNESHRIFRTFTYPEKKVWRSMLVSCIAKEKWFDGKINFRNR